MCEDWYRSNLGTTGLPNSYITIPKRSKEGVMEMPGFTKEQIEEMFTYHPPTEEQQEKYKMLRQTFMGMAILIKDVVPDSDTQTIAIRKLWECSMICNGAIATDGKV